MRIVVLAVAASLVLAACGKAAESTDLDQSLAAVEELEVSADAQAEDEERRQLIKTLEARKVACPPKVPQRAQSAPVDDVIGLRIGTTVDAAEAVLLCPKGAKARTVIEYQDSSTAGQYGESGREFLIAQIGELSAKQTYSPDEMRGARDLGIYGYNVVTSGTRWDRIDEKLQILLVGLKGSEQVIGIWRTQYFAEGAQPTRQAIFDGLRQKYGPDSGGEFPSWVYDSTGRLLEATEDYQSSYVSCVSGMQRVGSFSWREGCGLTIVMGITVRNDNPEIVESVSVGLIDQQTALNASLAFEDQLKSKQETLRQQELEKAKEVAPPTKF